MRPGMAGPGPPQDPLHRVVLPSVPTAALLPRPAPPSQHNRLSPQFAPLTLHAKPQQVKHSPFGMRNLRPQQPEPCATRCPTTDPQGPGSRAPRPHGHRPSADLGRGQPRAPPPDASAEVDVAWLVVLNHCKLTLIKEVARALTHDPPGDRCSLTVNT